MSQAVALVSMPWALLQFPSIALGILNSVLRKSGIEPAVKSYNLAFMDFVLHKERSRPAAERLSLSDYNGIASTSTGDGLGDWIFAVPPFKSADERDDNSYFESISAGEGISSARVDAAKRLRAWMPEFIDQCVEDLLSSAIKVVGFTTTFNQNVSSLVLAQRLKQRDPSIKVVFGGANCDGPMGTALFDAFPWVDAVVQGEAEGVIVELVRGMLEGRAVAPRPGVLIREAISSDPEASSKTNITQTMDDVPTPNYDFYFEALEQVSFRDSLLSEVQLPVETARGCWWGQKHHCTFCGLNGATINFRSKSVDRALRDFLGLAERYRCLDFMAVDNIIDVGYLKELLPRIIAEGIDLKIFYETKSNLSQVQIRRMRDAGIHRIQPGIESISTPILRLMRKGVSGWQNVRLLKWCAQYGIVPEWNLLYGFPNEPEDEYDRMAAQFASMTHLQPPHLVRMKVQRFSPYYEQPEAFGIRVDGPREYYRYIYPVDEPVLKDLAYMFDFSFAVPREPDAYIQRVSAAIDRWHDVYSNDEGALTYRRGPGFIHIVDERTSRGYNRYVLEGEQAAAYLECDAGATAMSVCRKLQKAGYSGLDVDDVEPFLQDLVDAGLMFESDGHFVSLALPECRHNQDQTARPESTVSRRRDPQEEDVFHLPTVH